MATAGEKRLPVDKSSLALISDAHRERYRLYYASKDVRVKPHAWQGQIEKIALNLSADSVLDYGCGPSKSLSRFSSLNVVDFDPAVDGADELPDPCDLVVCNHMLEHVEPECLDNILRHIKSLAKKAVYIALSCELSTKKLPDGTEWHLIVREPLWWQKKLDEFFDGYVTLRPINPKTEFVMLWRR